MGKQVFWASVQSSAGCKPLAFLQWAFGASAAGEHWLEPQAIQVEELPRRLFSLGAISCATTWASGAVAVLSWAADTAGFFNDTQASCLIWKLCHFLPFHKKNSTIVCFGMLEIRMMYPKQFWCVSSVCCVGGCAAMHITVSYMKSGNGEVLTSLSKILMFKAFPGWKCLVVGNIHLFHVDLVTLWPCCSLCMMFCTMHSAVYTSWQVLHWTSVFYMTKRLILFQANMLF